MPMDRKSQPAATPENVEPDSFADAGRLAEAADFLRIRLPRIPGIVIVLGSGLGYLAEKMETEWTSPSSAIPGYPQPTVEGHQGRLIFGQLNGIEILAVQGRSHYYEGRSIAEVTFPVQLFHELGIPYLILTNAAGSARPEIAPGSLVFLTDYLNFPQIRVVPGQEDLHPFSRRLAALAYGVSRSQSLKTYQGVYCWTTGPSYETSVEVKLIRDLGGSVVGMSTVPEALMAAYFGMEVLGISLVTNFGTGIAKQPLTHAEVQLAADEVKKPYTELIGDIIRHL